VLQLQQLQLYSLHACPEFGLENVVLSWEIAAYAIPLSVCHGSLQPAANGQHFAAGSYSLTGNHRRHFRGNIGNGDMCCWFGDCSVGILFYFPSPLQPFVASWGFAVVVDADALLCF